MRKGDRFVSEPSFVPVENLMFGRLAFKGMNTEIESMMADRDQKFADIESRKQEKDVTDEDMANRYSGLVATMGNKFATKRNSSGQPSGDRRQALLDMAGQTTNAHTSSLLSKTEDFLSETRRDSAEMHPEQVLMARSKLDEEDFLAQVRESELCQENQPMHPEMALMASKRKEKDEFLAQVKECEELQNDQQIHPEMAFMAKKKQKKSKATEKQTKDFLSQMRNELGESSEV